MDGYVPYEELKQGAIDRLEAETGNSRATHRSGSQGRGRGRGVETAASGGTSISNQNGSSQQTNGGFELQPGQFPLYDGLSWTVEVGRDWVISAAQLRHRVPCWGYVFNV
jgi:hypothetical protein